MPSQAHGESRVAYRIVSAYLTARKKIHVITGTNRAMTMVFFAYDYQPNAPRKSTW